MENLTYRRGDDEVVRIALGGIVVVRLCRRERDPLSSILTRTSASPMCKGPADKILTCNVEATGRGDTPATANARKSPDRALLPEGALAIDLRSRSTSSNRGLDYLRAPSARMIRPVHAPPEMVELGESGAEGRAFARERNR
jgi:hypothetical protein